MYEQSQGFISKIIQIKIIIVSIDISKCKNPKKKSIKISKSKRTAVISDKYEK